MDKIKLYFLLTLCIVLSCTSEPKGFLSLDKNDNIVLIGGNLCSSMLNFGHFETKLHLKYPDSLLFVRNMCDAGNTAGFRPHSGRNLAWAFPGAETFHPEYAQSAHSEGHFKTEDEWLHDLKADIIIGFFGYSESFNGTQGLENFKSEISVFIDYTMGQTYNTKSPPKLILVTPIAFQDLSSKKIDLPDGQEENKNLKLYADAMISVANEKGIPCVDAFSETSKWFKGSSKYTSDGFQLNESGHDMFATFLLNQIFGKTKKNTTHQELVKSAVLEKNWFWKNDFKIPNGVHVFGRRYNPFGPDNYPAEIKKIRELTSIRDSAIHLALKGVKLDYKSEDQKTSTLPSVKTNFNPEDTSQKEYLYGNDALESLTVAPGYEIDLFASEAEFPDLANPVQLSFDNKGRLWVAVMPSYPHYKPGDSKPNDKLLILEDTNGDGRADKQTVFADGLHLPIGFEFAPEGVYLSQGSNLVLLSDTNGDDKADTHEIILSGFDDHDTHHAISAFCADPSGAIYMGEGVFLHSNIETAYGTVRATNGGFYRYNPQRRHLERTAQIPIPNPWGIAFDAWGQNFFAETSSTHVRWMMPSSGKPVYGKANHMTKSLLEEAHRVRPTSGLEFVSSRHFPDEVQGDLLINNTIGFLGTKQHTMEEDGTGYSSKHRLDLVKSTDTNFRPVDMEFAPDGSLYLVDWHNVLIGHMQHNARDPLRDHVHGRIYRITYPERPLVSPAKIVDASIPELLENLKLPEYRTRYRTRRELRARSKNKVLKALRNWVKELEEGSPNYDQYVIEALWVSWGANAIDESILNKALNAKDHRARAAATRVLRYAGHQIDKRNEMLMTAVQDPHGRVRLEAITAASWLTKDEALAILHEALKLPLDDWMIKTHAESLGRISGEPEVKIKEEEIVSHLKGDDLALLKMGKKIYEREGYCQTCHGKDGQGIIASQFPPLAGTDWVTGNEDRLIKLSLHGLYGPIEVNKKQYPGVVPMTPFKGLLNDDELAAVLSYIRNAFGNKASVISSEHVKELRAATAQKEDFYSPAALLKEHPDE